MKKEEIEKKIADIKGSLEIKALNKCSAIIQVAGMFTVGTDKEGKIQLENTEYPTFFSMTAAKEIVAHIKKNNLRKEIKIISENEFLKGLLNDYTEMLSKI